MSVIIEDVTIIAGNGKDAIQITDGGDECIVRNNVILNRDDVYICRTDTGITVE